MYTEIAKTIRVLSVDAIQRANSGHSGMPLGMADIAAVFMVDFYKFHPDWLNRDRLIISNGHGSMLLYSMLYLAGYLKSDDLKNFRQLFSLTPGHPEFGVTHGVDMSTGPLGQGLASSLGFALSERMLNAKFGDAIDHYTYVFAGDGCIMEGISHEACSLAGHLSLKKLIVVFDDNGISIDGQTSIATSDDIALRFTSYNWNVIKSDGHDFDSIKKAFNEARESDKPTIICFKTTIGKYVSSREGTSSAHSGPFTDEEVCEMKSNLNWTLDDFEAPEQVKNFMSGVTKKNRQGFVNWKKSASESGVWDRIEGFLNEVPDFDLCSAKKESVKALPSKATRVAFSEMLSKTVSRKFVGGSADLSPSNGTKLKSSSVITKDDFSGNYIHYGIREHAMAACMNGFALYGAFIPYGGTFFVFSDYLRPSVRLAALMKSRVIHVFTHDSIGVGEDGPTHQPIEQLASFRAMPDVYVFRPADSVETAECWSCALKIQAPVLMVLSRQVVRHVRFEYSEENLCSKGAYILHDCTGEPEVTLVATGSEVGLAFSVYEKLSNKINLRIISFPCFRLFDECNEEYKDVLFGNDGLKIVLEAGVPFGWDKYVGNKCKFFCINEFGLSAKSADLYNHFGLTTDRVIDFILTQLKK